MIVAVIPARGGSKGIPRKNVLPVGGLPLLAHSILHARRSRLVDLVVVSTDDPEIAEVARRYGAEVVDRPAELASDGAASEPTLAHALAYVRDRHGPVDLVVFLQPTSPLRRPDDIDGAIRHLRAEGADSLLSACPMHGFVWRDGPDTLRSLTYDHEHRPRRQDLGGDDWQENGSIYVFAPWVLDELGNRLGGRVALWPMHPLDSFQVDEPGDLELIDSLFALRAPLDAPPDLHDVDLLVLDFDGVLTDNRVLVDEHGTESVWCDRGDGWGVARVREAGVPVVILSTERNGVVAARARKLGVECVQDCPDKAVAVREIAERHGVGLDRVAFVGNDVNDLPALSIVGFPVAVADARPEVVRVARASTTRAGGHGAVREVCDWLVAARATRPSA